MVRVDISDASGVIYSTQEFAYDQAGNCTTTSTYNQNGKAVETTQYDAIGRVLKKTDALKQSTHYWYDHNKAYFEVTDALGNKMCATQDAMGRVTTLKRVNPYGITTKKAEYFFDAAGNKARGGRICFTY